MSPRHSHPLALVVAAAALTLLPHGASAEVPRVVADIAPVHGLVARVMQGLGEPALLMRPGVSPHDYALRPSEAAALEDAGLVFFIGPELSPWITRPLDALAADAERVELLAAPGTRLLPTRTPADFARGDRAAQPGGGAPAETAAGAADDAAAEDAVDDHAGHEHGGVDPHAWLDPENARTWLGVIADRLAVADPANGAAYAANAAAGEAEIAAATEALAARLAPLAGLRFIVYHDAFQYLERRFSLAAAGAVSPGDAAAPGAGELAALKTTVLRLGVTCALTEPQFDPRLLDAVVGQGVRTAVLDPLGAALEPGAGFYPALLASLGDGLAGCR